MGARVMVKSPIEMLWTSILPRDYPSEVLGRIDPEAKVKIILAVIDEDDWPVNRHLFWDRKPAESASPEVIDDYIRWLRGD
jgi:hypothetical protein